jgi:hypothetical protein
MIQLVDKSKKGTLILGYYRNGTHFLQDTILDLYPGIQVYDEIGNDNTINDLEQLTQSSGYKICILNNTAPKFYLAGRRDLLDQWHIINLTRNNKVQHFISYWFWEQNTLQERISNSGKFSHHNTKHDVYKNSMLGNKVCYDIEAIIAWLQEQLINFHIAYNETVDYDELPKYQTDNISWTPNQYHSIGLADIFENHQEIHNLLSSFPMNMR